MLTKRPMVIGLTICLSTIYGCGDDPANVAVIDKANQQELAVSEDGVSPPATKAISTFASRNSVEKSAAPNATGKLATPTSPPTSARLTSTPAHSAHDHGKIAGPSTLAGNPTAQTPPAPVYETSGKTAMMPSRAVALTGHQAVTRSATCTIDFNDPGALLTGSVPHYFDRFVVPWWQACDTDDYIDLRPSKYGHFHLGFQDATVEPCWAEPTAHPAHVDSDGNCTLVDLATEPRSYATVHWWDEVLKITPHHPLTDTPATFDLNRIRIMSDIGARVCYRPASTPPSSGPWVTSTSGTGSTSGALGGWLCWKHLGPGLWDLSPWATDLSEAKITSSSVTPGSFSVDDIEVTVH